MERQHERIALIEEKDNYYGVFDHLVEGIFRTTPDGHYLLANVALARIYGYDSPVELMASITDIAQRLYVEPGRREEFVRLMQDNDTITGFESKIYRKDETIIWISENCRAVRDAQGNLLYYEGTVEDITERKHAEEQIRRTTAELSRSREELRAKNLLMEENLRMAREIQTAMLPQQYPVFPPGRPAGAKRVSIRPPLPAGRIRQRRFLQRLRAFRQRSRRVHLRRDRPRRPRRARHRHDPRAGRGIETARARSGNVFCANSIPTCAPSSKPPARRCSPPRFISSPTGRPASCASPTPAIPSRCSSAARPNRVEPLANACGRSQPALGLFDDPPYRNHAKPPSRPAIL